MAESSIKTILRHYVQKLKSFFIPKNVLSFLLFLALSTAFWFTNALDKTRETEIRIPIEYKGLPKNILITNDTVKYLTVTVSDKGLNLFSYSNVEKLPMAIELSQFFNSSGDIVLSRDQLKIRISRYLLPTTAILNISPASLHIKYQQLSVRKKYVKLIASVEPAAQYILSNDIKFWPTMVTVYGPKGIVDTLSSVCTEKLVVSDLKDTLVTTCKIKQIPGIRYSVDEVTAKIITEMFTEKTVDLPVTIINAPPGVSIRCFPALVKATFNIGMSHFSKMNENDIRILFDYNEMDRQKNTKQKLNIEVNSKCISNVRVNPDEIEYIIE